ncbi:MAG: YcfL family protein [Campylobacteraceae bacterium]|nr:YcfL family protein [Campylobacteraceae bacterium]
MKKQLFGLVATFMLAGCGISPVERLAEHNIIVENKSIMSDFKIVSVVSKDRNDGLKEAQAVLKNDTRKNREIAYKVDWIDKDGFTRDSILSKWKVVRVEAGRDVVIGGISPSSDVSDFKIRINYPTKDDKLRKNPANYEYQGK